MNTEPLLLQVKLDFLKYLSISKEFYKIYLNTRKTKSGWKFSFCSRKWAKPNQINF